MKSYLCTVGTSCARRYGLNRLPEVIEARGVETAAAELVASFEGQTPEDLCAELSPLSSLGLSATDRVVLYLSDTEVGQAVGLALKRYLPQQMPKVEVLCRRIEGLQVDNEERFRSVGVVNFLKRLGDDITSFGPWHCVLNPLGGFKALVPFAVLMAMIRSVETVYRFEGSPALIKLPPLPIDFSESLLSSVQRVYEVLERETAVPRDQLESLLGKRVDDESVALLFEPVDNEFTLSGIGHLLYHALDQKRPLVPFVSYRAIGELEQLDGRQDCLPYDFLRRVCASRDYFEEKLHGNAGGGLSWLKPGRTTDRYLVSVEDGWRLLVWRALAHQEYDTLHMPGEKYRREAASFSPFVRLNFFRLEAR